MNDFDTHEKKDLLYKLQSGYLTAFTRVYHHYSKILSNLTGIRLKNLAGPEEIVQNIFFDLFKLGKDQKIAGYSSSKLSAFLKYKVVSVIVKRNLQHLHSSYPFRQIGFLIDNKIIEKLRSTELQHGLMHMAGKLPAKDIIVFRLRGERGFIQKQIETKQINCMT